MLLLLLFLLAHSAQSFLTTMGTGNTRRSAKRLQKQLRRTDKNVMRQGRVVATPFEATAGGGSAFPAPWTFSSSGSSSSTAAAPPSPFEVSLVAPNEASYRFSNGTELRVNTTHLHQRTDMQAWLAARKCLLVTASEFAAVLGKSPFTKRPDLLATKLGTKAAFGGNAATAWGLRVEPLAVKQYAEATGNTVYETGLWTHGNDLRLGASPDGLVFDPRAAAAAAAAGDGSTAAAAAAAAVAADDDEEALPPSADGYPQGILEVKCFFGRRHKKELAQWTNCPNRFYDQIQGQLEVCDREWCDLMLWIPKNSRKRNYCIIRVDRNREYFEQTLKPELDAFCDELETARALAKALQ